MQNKAKDVSMDYQGMKDGIRKRLEGAAEDFFMVGYLLRQVSENTLFAEDGYKTIWEFAKGEYGLSASTASRFMAINARFSVDGGERMAEKYIGMGVSKLQEMLGLPDEELEKVTQETTVREIRAMKKKQEEPKSFFGLPKTVRPEGSLITTPGCGDGKHSCFLCTRECEIRQEDRQCRTAICGNPFPCTQMGEEKRLDMKAGLFADKCQHLHPGLAPVSGGSQEPDPCCLTCGHETCYSRCDVAKKRDGDGRKEVQARIQKQQDENGGGKPEMTEKETEILYRWLGIKAWDVITASWLKEIHGKVRHGGSCKETGGFYCSPHGVRTGQGKEMTWAQAAKALKQVQEEKKGQEAGKEEARLLGFYKDIYPSTRQVISQRDRAAITKELKFIYGSTYENGEGWSAYPDKIVFRNSPGGEQLQVTWGRFAAKLVGFLDSFPEVEGSALAGDEAGRNRPEIIDAVFQEVGDSGEPDSAAIQETDTDGSPEGYTKLDVSLLLDKYSRELTDCRKCFVDDECPPPILKKNRILVDALELLILHF